LGETAKKARLAANARRWREQHPESVAKLRELAKARRCVDAEEREKLNISNGIIKRRVAISRGEKLYFTGKMCKNGHIAQRTVVSKQCIECIKIWNAAEYRRDTRRAEYAKNSEAIKQQSRKWYENNRERASVRAKKYAISNELVLRARRRAYYMRNKDTIVKKIRAYKELNKEQVSLWRRAGVLRYKARLKGAGGKFKLSDVAVLFDMQKKQMRGLRY